MDWSNENVLEFIDLLEGESCIWNPKCKTHKNRNFVFEAWMRLRSKFSLPCTIKELKKKRNILLTQYRECVKKIKESRNSGPEHVYKPVWFAFDAFHKYMGPIYDNRSRISTEIQESTDENPLSPEPMETKFERRLSRESSVEIEMPESHELNSDYESDSNVVPKMQDLLVAKKQMDQENDNVCDLYGQLLSQKLKTLDVNNRLVLMNEIDNTVFKYTMQARKRIMQSNHGFCKKARKFRFRLYYK